MKLLGVISVLLAGVSGGYVNDLDAPFQTQVLLQGDGKLLYTAATTPADLPNDRHGDQLRLHYLGRYLAAKHLCPNGYDVLDKKVAPDVRPRKYDMDERDGWVTYSIACRPGKGSN